MSHISIPDETTVAVFDVTAAQTVFPIDFVVFSKRDLKATVDSVELEQGDFSFAGTELDGGGYQGGTVTLAVAAASCRVVIWRQVETQRTSNFTPALSVPIRDLDTALDKLQAQAQDARRDFTRTVLWPADEHGGVVPPIDVRSGRLWAWDSTGGLISVPGIDNSSVITDLNYATAYYDTNADALPRLVLDVDGEGSTPIDGVVNPGGPPVARVMFQASHMGGDVSGSLVHLNGLFRNWAGGNHPTQNRSKYTVFIGAKSQIDAWLDVDAGHLYGQEVGCLYLNVVGDYNVNLAKLEAGVFAAREATPTYGADGKTVVVPSAPAKVVVLQTSGVKHTAGPVPDDRNQFADDSGDNPEQVPATGDVVTGVAPGGFVRRANAAGTHRHWSIDKYGGLGGSYNGLVAPMPKHKGSSWTDPFTGVTFTTDRDGINGLGGIWGGSFLWMENCFRVLLKDECPGFMTVAHDGGANGDIARAPVDIAVDTVTNVPAQWTGAGRAASERQAVLMFNGKKLLGARNTGWTAMTGTPVKTTIAAAAAGTASGAYTQAELQGALNRIAALEARLKAYDDALFAHGLIGT